MSIVGTLYSLGSYRKLRNSLCGSITRVISMMVVYVLGQSLQGRELLLQAEMARGVGVLSISKITDHQIRLNWTWKSLERNIADSKQAHFGLLVLISAVDPLPRS